MDQDETIALFKRCEAARNLALDDGRSESEAHEAAKSIWNGWAEAMLARRKALESCGKWQARKVETPGYGKPSFEALNEETQAWMEAARSDFSRLDLRTRDSARVAEPQLANSPKPFLLKGDRIAFDGFVFPGNANFYRTSFFRIAGFDGAVFHGTAEFWG